MTMQFEDFSPSVSGLKPIATKRMTLSPSATAAERFFAISTAVESAIKGNFDINLQIGGNDQLSRLANNINQLFELMRDGSIATAVTPADFSVHQSYDDLNKANARLEYLIANTPAIIYSSVPTGDFKMTFVSENVSRVLGYTPEEMLGDPNFWFDHIHPNDIPAIFSSLAQIFSEGQRAYEYRFKAKDGRFLWMHDTLRLIRDANGNPLEVVGSLTDITERKLMEEALQEKGEEQRLLIKQLHDAQAQLLQSEKMASIGQLAAGVAHEINNPVGFVNSNLGTLRNYVSTLLKVIESYDRIIEKLPVDADLAASVAQLREQADFDFLAEDVIELVKQSMEGLARVKNIVQSLKDFSHVDEAEWQFSDLHHGIESTLVIANNEFRDNAVVIREFGTLPRVKCLASQLNQVFMNLIVNAAHAIKANGIITIKTGCRDDWVWIEIGDNGEGIPKENISRIFDPFFTTKPIGKGTGLGLSLSYNIIAKHGGRIDVESEIGKGTRFTIHLPVNGQGGI
jgi:two-component system NtrC family sensor kinase